MNFPAFFFGRHAMIAAGSLAIALMSASTYACSLAPSAYDLKAALASPHPTLVIFRGHVVSAEDTHTAEKGARARKYHFRVEQWWYGAPRERIVARGSVGTMAGTSCEGTYDFSASPGEEWLIVGYEENGVIDPSRMLSKPLIGGVLPLNVRQLLESKSPVKVKSE
jgi:hypothetical protein